MKNFEEYWLFVRKYLFSILLIVAGITCAVIGISKNEMTDLSQNNIFLYAAISMFVLGCISLYFIISSKISKIILIVASLLFAIGTFVFVKLNVKSVQDRILYLKQVETSKKLAKQGLGDIKKLQEAYEKKYEKFATSFEELLQFAKYDSIRVLTKAERDLPTDKMTVPQAKALKLKYPKPWTEEFALKLNLIIREYNKVPVAEYIFNKKKNKREKREYKFDVDKLEVHRTIDNSEKKFRLKSAVKDSTVKVLIQAIPPYGPQEKHDIKDTLQIGSLIENHMKTTWNK